MKKVLLMLVVGMFISQFGYAKQLKGVDLPGLIKGAEIVWKDSDTITIKPGYGECSGKYWQITSEADIELNDTDILSGGLPYGEDYIYIYIDYSSVSWGSALEIDATSSTDIIGSLTEPSWSDDKQGWYNGDDRCIGVVWSPEDSYTLTEFHCAKGNKYYLYTKHLLSSGSPDGTYQTLECTDQFPVNTVAVYLGASNSDIATYVRVAVSAYENVNQAIVDYSYQTAYAKGWVDIERGWTRDLKWYGSDDDDNNFQIEALGYQIEI